MAELAAGPVRCPCGSDRPYADCCARHIEGGVPAPTAEALMRSRYTAYTLLREDYLQATWHPSTCPQVPGITADAPDRWLGLEVKRHEQQGADHARVEFVARYKTGGRAGRLHEIGRFVRAGGRWLYVDGDII